MKVSWSWLYRTSSKIGSVHISSVLKPMVLRIPHFKKLSHKVRQGAGAGAAPLESGPENPPNRLMRSGSTLNLSRDGPSILPKIQIAHAISPKLLLRLKVFQVSTLLTTIFTCWRKFAVLQAALGSRRRRILQPQSQSSIDPVEVWMQHPSPWTKARKDSKGFNTCTGIMCFRSARLSSLENHQPVHLLPPRAAQRVYMPLFRPAKGAETLAGLTREGVIWWHPQEAECDPSQLVHFCQLKHLANWIKTVTPGLQPQWQKDSIWTSKAASAPCVATGPRGWLQESSWDPTCSRWLQSPQESRYLLISKHFSRKAAATPRDKWQALQQILASLAPYWVYRGIPEDILNSACTTVAQPFAFF